MVKANETESEHQDRLARQRVRDRENYWVLSPEERRERCSKKWKKLLANETKEQKELRILKQRDNARNWLRKKIANETPEEKEQRLAKNSAYARDKRANETPEERSDRLAKRRAYKQRVRAN